MPDFPKNPYKGQIFYDPDSDTVYKYFVPNENDEFCKQIILLKEMYLNFSF